jgi:hypothetical protein
MLRYFTSRDCSEKLGINLARWKRWSRAFLAPDPLGGQQSGYARQFSIDQVLTVHLGGMLISELKFSLPEALQILGDLKNWLGASGIYLNAEADPVLIETQLGVMDPCLMLIGYVTHPETGEHELGYSLYGNALKSNEYSESANIPDRIYVCFPIEGRPFIQARQAWTYLRVINMTRFMKEFVESLGLDARLYPSALMSNKL